MPEREDQRQRERSSEGEELTERQRGTALEREDRMKYEPDETSLVEAEEPD